MASRPSTTHVLVQKTRPPLLLSALYDLRCRNNSVGALYLTPLCHYTTVQHPSVEAPRLLMCAKVQIYSQELFYNITHKNTNIPRIIYSLFMLGCVQFSL